MEIARYNIRDIRRPPVGFKLFPRWSISGIKGVNRLLNYLRDKDTTQIADFYLFLISYQNFYFKFETEGYCYINGWKSYFVIVDSKDHDRNIQI